MNSTVANNTATDKDLGLNGTIEYTIADGNNEVCNGHLLVSVLQASKWWSTSEMATLTV